MSIDVTLVLTLHREGGYLFRTMMSLKEAVAFAQSKGIVIELVVILDRPDSATRNVLNKIDFSGFASSQTLETDFGSPGIARDAGKVLAKGKYIQFCDGDDLVSFNMLAAMYLEAERSNEKIILFPEWIFAFGKRPHYTQYVDLRFVTPLSFLDVHPYNSRGFYHRAICDRINFSGKGHSGYAYEDWKFNCDALALGYDFKVVADTILFYRQKLDSVLVRDNRDSVKAIATSKLFEPEIYTRICKSSIKQIRSRQLPKARLKGTQYFANPTCRFLTAAANRIDAEVDPEQIKGKKYVVSEASKLAIGLTYYDVCLKLRKQKFAHVFLLPWVIRGGADQILINIANTISRLQPNEQILVLTGQSDNKNVWLSKYSEAVTVINLGQYLSSIKKDGVNLITLKLIQATSPGATIHLRTCEFAFEFFRRFGRALSAQHKIVMYQFGNEIRCDGGFFFTIPFSPSFISDNTSYIDRFITDSEMCASYSLARTHTEGKWTVLPTLCNPTLDRETAIARTQKVSHKILWASRITLQKRPQLLVEIARLLLSLRPDLIIEVWGIAEKTSYIKQIRKFPNVVYKGTYDSFEPIANDDFLCFIYTSYFDGVPGVLLEAASAGLPIIASDVGGVGEFIKNNQTGILIPSVASDETMADAYVKAIHRLTDEPQFRADLVAQAYDRLVENYTTAPYVKVLKEALDI